MAKLSALTSVGVFGPPMSKFVFTRLARMVCSEDTRVYTGSGETSLHLVLCCSYYQHLVCSRGYKQAREGKDPKSLVKGVNGCRELDRCSCAFISWFGIVRIWIPLHGVSCFPFYRRRESMGYSGGKGEEREREGF